MASLFNIGISGMNAAQAGLNTTGHNITNAATPGFTRQQIKQTTNTPTFTGAGFIGQGANVVTVQRVYSDFLTRQATTALSTQGSLQAYADQIDQVDNMLADSTAGLTPALQGFFTGVQGLAANPGSNPSSTASRQALISNANTLVGRFNDLNQRLTDIQSNVNLQVETTVSSINAYAQQIVQVNQSIATAETAGPGQPANDLRDQRDDLMAQLSKLVGATGVPQTDGSLDVYIGNGIPLVIGHQAYSLTAYPSSTEPGQLDIALQPPGQTSTSFPVTQLTGGTLGGLIGFQSNTLSSAQSQLGQVAVSVAISFNNQHKLGQDLNGNLGQSFFSLTSIPVQSDTMNAATTTQGIVSASYDTTNVGALTSSDYRVDYAGGNYTVTRLSDSTVMGSTAPPAAAPPGTTTSVTADGVTFTFGQGTVTAGDSFVVQPTRYAAGGIGLTITNPTLVAAASPIRTNTPTANTGTGQIKLGSTTAPLGINTATGLPLASGITLTFNSGTNQFSVSGPAALGLPATLAYTPSSAGSQLSLNTSGSLSFSFSITGSPANGDSFVIQPNTGGTSDNSNALALGQLQTSNIMGNGKTTFQSAYAQLVGIVGNTARDKQVSLTAQNTVVTQLQATQQSVSGVNLDEEAANLIRYQQAYQAAGKVITIAGKLFDQLLTM